jgi:MYXO-CTERM domain-containing protein
VNGVRSARSLAACAVSLGVLSCGPGQGTGVFGHVRQAAGSYAGGLDVAGALSVSQAQSYQTNDGITWSGAYIGGACNGGSGWTKSVLTSISQATGWTYMPIYVGQQDSSICSASTLTAPQGTADGQDTVTVMGQYAWVPDGGIPVCLDVEAGTYSNNPSSTLSYVQAWADAVHAGGYKAYVYSSPDAINAFAAMSLPIDAVWIADWTYPSNSFEQNLSPYGITSVTAYTNHDRAWQYCDGTVDSDTADLVLAPPPGQTIAPAPTLSQLAANDAVSAFNWPDGHAEAFFTTPGGQLMHLSTTGTTETWSASASLATGASCGPASIYWPSPWLYGEVFSPLADGGTGHLWETGGTWNGFQAYGGTDLGHFQTVTWPDGHTEVFALGADGAVWHQWWDVGTSAWSGWQSLAGSFTQGPSAMLWNDGHGEVFATAAGGVVSHAVSNASGWSTWSSLGGALASMPVPVRTPNGDVTLVGIGTDGALYAATSNGTWGSFAAVTPGGGMGGQPAAVPNSDGSLEVFARDSMGRVVHTRSGNPSWSAVQVLGTALVASSDAFGWTRSDGSVDVFAVDSSGNLSSLHRDTSGTWGSAWTTLSGGAAACSPVLTVPDGGSGQDSGMSSGSDAGNGTDGGSASDGGTSNLGPDGGTGGATGGCGCAAASTGAAWGWVGLAFIALAVHRMRCQRRWVQR